MGIVIIRFATDYLVSRNQLKSFYCRHGNFIEKMILILYCSSYTFSQKKITGRAQLANNSPVEGATIAIKNSNVATFSATDGSFSIIIKPGDILLVSSIGMNKKAVQVGNETFIVIPMTFGTNNMEEVMVIGYGTSRRKDITGAVLKLTATEFNEGIITNPLQRLQGKVAGLEPGHKPLYQVLCSRFFEGPGY